LTRWPSGYFLTNCFARVSPLVETEVGGVDGLKIIGVGLTCRQFCAESFSIAIAGGALGIVFGIVLSELIAFYSEWAVSWSIPAIVLSFSICALIGVIFGVYPAMKASELDPITALQTD
jgi:ABC-type lipoprotein release transport system permease subunit